MKPKTILVLCLLLFGVFDLVYGLFLRDGVSIVAGAAIVVIGGVILKRSHPPR